jgi:hypothetical protein
MTMMREPITGYRKEPVTGCRKEPVTGCRKQRRYSREQIEEALRTGVTVEDDDLVQWHEARSRTIHEVSVRSYIRKYRKNLRVVSSRD